MLIIMNYDIDSEIILQRDSTKLVYLYSLIIIILLHSLLLISLILKYQTYYKTSGIIVNEDDHYYMIVYTSLDDSKIIFDNTYLYIENKKYDYEVVSLLDYEVINGNTYQKTKIKLNIPDKYHYSNLTINIKFPKSDKLIINYILYK